MALQDTDETTGHDDDDDDGFHGGDVEMTSTNTASKGSSSSLPPTVPRSPAVRIQEVYPNRAEDVVNPMMHLQQQVSSVVSRVCCVLGDFYSYVCCL